MTRCHRFHFRRLLAGALILSGFVPARAADLGSVTLFNSDSKHLWNRVYATLGAGMAKGIPFWNGPGEAQLPEMAAVLGEFVKETKLDGMLPLQRAVMQRQLLAHFQAAVSGQLQEGGSGKKIEWMRLLVRAARQVALSAEEIRKLPDNYAAAVALPGTATVYDAAKPAAYLPKDLLADDGPWVGLELTPGGGRQGVVAEFHFELFRGHTSFEVRMRHPEGRAAGEAYLKKLAAMTDPYAPAGDEAAAKLLHNGPADRRLPNPATPQFPPGTAWALVHRAILADTKGQPVVSPLVESVQIRVYRTGTIFEAWQSKEVEKQVEALEAENKKYDRDFLAAERYQTAFEWTMHGAAWLEKKPFHLATADETLFGNTGRSTPVTVVCMQCHSPPGIHSVNSRAGLFHSGKMTRPPEFQPARRERIDAVTIEAAGALPAWVELKKRWAEEG
jgi:hypothetical protein